MQQITSLFATFVFLLSASFLTWDLIPTWCFLAITPCLVYWAHLLEPTSNFLGAILGYAWHPRLPKCPWLAPFTIPIQSFVMALVVLNALTVLLHYFNVWAKLFPYRVVFPRDPNALKHSNLLSYPFPTVSWSTVNLRTKIAKFHSNESRNIVVREEPPTSSESSTSTSNESFDINPVQLTQPKNGKTYRPPCPICRKWHKKGEPLCDSPMPRSTTISALHGDNKLRSWLDTQCSSIVDPARITVVRSFLQSAKAQVQIVSKMSNYGLIYPPNSSAHTKSTVIEHEYNTNKEFASALEEAYSREIQLYAGLNKFQIPSPTIDFLHPDFKF